MNSETNPGLTVSEFSSDSILRRENRSRREAVGRPVCLDRRWRIRGRTAK
jgi:hypothetical protein